MLVTTIISFVKAKKNNRELSYVDLGLSTVEHKNSIDFKLLAKGLLLAICLASYMYIQCFLAEKAFLLDFRFIWPFFKGFSIVILGQFFVYIIIFLVFFLLNNLD